MASNILLFLIMALSLISLNCNGLRSKSKLDNVFTFFRIRKFDVICLQETYWDDTFMTDIVSSKWDGEIYYSNADNTKRSKGVAILFRHGLDVNLNTSSVIRKGRALEVQFEMDGKKFSCVKLICSKHPQ